MSPLLAIFVFKIAFCKLECYTGNQPLDATSPLFSIKLTQETEIVSPHVYYAKVNNNNLPSNLGPGWYNRTISWIEFGQTSSDVTTIQVSVKNNKYPLFNNTEYPVRILPYSYNINPSLSVINDYQILFKVYGNYKSISVEFGDYLVGNNKSNFQNSLLIFIGDISEPINKSASNVIYFPPGVHNISNKGGESILNIPSNIDTIYIDRGAFVYGKINDTGNSNGVFNVLGYGILSGDYFNYLLRWNNTLSHFCMIDSNRSVNLHGLTVYNPSWFMTPNEFKPNSTIQSFKGIGWYPNNDGPGVSSNSVIRHSFCRTADGQWKIETGSNILLENNVAWQTFNGDIMEMGWYGKGCVNCTVRDIDIIHAEWRHSKGPGSSVIALNGHGPGFTQYTNSIYHDILYYNIRIDTPVGRVIGISFYNISEGANHTLYRMNVQNVTSRTPLRYTTDSKSNVTTPYNFLEIKFCDGFCEITGIHFENIMIGGKKILNNTQDGWNLYEIGEIISNITYS